MVCWRANPISTEAPEYTRPASSLSSLRSIARASLHIAHQNAVVPPRDCLEDRRTEPEAGENAPY